MSKMMRVVVMVTALTSLFAIAASSAGAVTWDVTTGGEFTATGGAGTLSGNGFSLTCSSSDATATSVANGSYSGSTVDLASGTATFTGCRLGGVATHVACNFTLTAQAQTAGTHPLVTNGLVDVTCAVTQGVTKVCHIDGSTAAHYRNPTEANGIRGQLTLTATNTLVATHGTVDCPLVGTPSTQATASLSEQTITVLTPSFGPFIQRTA